MLVYPKAVDVLLTAFCAVSYGFLKSDKAFAAAVTTLDPVLPEQVRDYPLQMFHLNYIFVVLQQYIL